MEELEKAICKLAAAVEGGAYWLGMFVFLGLLFHACLAR